MVDKQCDTPKPLFNTSTGGRGLLHQALFEHLVVLLSDAEEEALAILAQETEGRNILAEHGLEALAHDLVEPRLHHCPHLGKLILATCPDMVRCCVYVDCMSHVLGDLCVLFVGHDHQMLCHVTRVSLT